MATVTPHCSLSYHQFNPTDLENFGHHVSTGIYTSTPPFSSPPYTQVVFDGFVSAFHDTYIAYKNGGADQKGAYMTAHTNLMEALDATAHYVDELPGVNEDMITRAGYTPTKTGDTKAVVPATPEVEKIDRPAKGTLEPSCKAVHGAEYYGCIILEHPWGDGMGFMAGQIGIEIPTPIPSLPAIRIIVTKGRKKTAAMLTSGKEYGVYFYAGNSAGVSALSGGVSIICG